MQLSLSRVEGSLHPGKKHIIFLRCQRNEVSSYSTYLTIHNLGNPKDIKIVRVSTRVCACVSGSFISSSSFRSPQTTPLTLYISRLNIDVSNKVYP